MVPNVLKWLPIPYARQKQAIGKTVSIARLSMPLKTITNHRTIDARPKTGEIVIRSLSTQIKTPRKNRRTARTTLS